SGEGTTGGGEIGGTGSGSASLSNSGSGSGGTTGSGGGGAGGSTGGTTGAASAAGGTTGSAGPGGPVPSTGTNCPDYNPNQGVFCDHYLVGGTTVLSGPLAVYGQQGLKAGQAWLSYFNTEVAPKQHIRQVKLIWYDDNLDPNKTLQYVQRLNEVDHVLYLAGI